MKTIVRLTEQDLHEVIKESVNKILNEYGYRTASLVHGANYNAMQSDMERNDLNAKSKMDASENLRLKSLNHAISDTLGDIHLTFIETNPKNNQGWSVEFSFQNVIYIDQTRFVMDGDMVVANREQLKGKIEYNFKTGKFFRVNFYAGGSVRRIYPMRVHRTSTETANKLLLFIFNFLYSESDYESNVNTNGSTMSKKH